MRSLKLFGVASLIFACSGNVLGQRINFSLWSGSEDVSIQSVGAQGNYLNFNDKVQVIKANSPAIQIEKHDSQVAIFEIEAPSDLDITIAMDYVSFLANGGDVSKGSIPLVLNMAYSNINLPNENAANTNSIDLPLGITSVSIPVVDRRSGPPLPPRPEFGGDYVKPKSKVYLFIYGTLGPIGQVSAGAYTGEITISVYVEGGSN